MFSAHFEQVNWSLSILILKFIGTLALFELWPCSEDNGDGGHNLSSNGVARSLIFSEFGSDNGTRRITCVRDVC